MALRQRHRHVEVGDAGDPGGAEDRLVEARVAGVEDGVGARLADQRDERVLVARVDLRGAEAVRLAEPVDDRLRALAVDVGEHHVGEEAAPLGDCGCRGADAAGPDDEDSHVVRP